MKQPQNQNSAEPQKETEHGFMRIIRYHSIIISKNVGSILLIINHVATTLLHKDRIPSFYILLANNILPFLISLVINEEKIKKEKQPFPLLAKKFNYTYIKYLCNSLSSIFVFFLLCLWQIREFNKNTGLSLFSFCPIVILLIMLFVRIGSNLVYRRKLHKMLLDCDF